MPARFRPIVSCQGDGQATDHKVTLVDFSTRTNVPSDAELEALKCRDGETLLIVLTSGPSGTPFPSADLFDELISMSLGFSYKDGVPRECLNSEYNIRRPGRPTLHFRSADFQNFELIDDERLAS